MISFLWAEIMLYISACLPHSTYDITLSPKKYIEEGGGGQDKGNSRSNCFSLCVPTDLNSGTFLHIEGGKS